MHPRTRFLITAALIGLAFVITLLDFYYPALLPNSLPAAGRWLAIGWLSYLCWQKRSLTTWILFSMVIGVEIGTDFPQVAQELKVVSKIFLKLIKTIIAPLIFGTLVVGIAGHADLKQVGRMGWKSLLYFEVVTTIALFIGLLAINISQAGVGIDLPPMTESEPLEAPPPAGWEETVLHIFPENIAKSIAEGQILQIVVFSILFAIGLALVKEPHKRKMLDFCESLTEVMFKFTSVIMYFAPFAVGAAVTGNVCNYALGKLLGNRLLSSQNQWVVKYLLPPFAKTSQFYDRYGAGSIIAGRFFPIVRTYIPFLAGVVIFPYRKFLFLSFTGAAAWVLVFTLTGYFVGEIPWVQDNYGLIFIGLIVLTSLPVVLKVIHTLWERRKKNISVK